MPAKAKSATKTKGRQAGDVRKRPDGERKRPLSAFARRARRRANETLEETTKQNKKVFARLAKKPVMHLDFEVADLIREDRERR